jgi:hypothetical protein
MDFVAFPLRIERGRGRLARSGGEEESLFSLLWVMTHTSRRGWRGSPDFGLGEVLVDIRRNHDASRAAVKQITRALEDLGVDWVRVVDLRWVGSEQPGEDSYAWTFVYPGKDNETKVVVWGPGSRHGAT